MCTFQLPKQLKMFLFQDEDFLTLIFKAMMKDALNSSHPVSSSVQSSEQIEEMFDALSYIKVTVKIFQNIWNVIH